MKLIIIIIIIIIIIMTIDSYRSRELAKQVCAVL